MSDKKIDTKPPRLSATVVLVRDTSDGIEVLMLRRNSRISFGGNWVFPGGRIEESDYIDGNNIEAAARVAVQRELIEETGIELNSTDFTWIAHWTPSVTAIVPARFIAYFYLTRVAGGLNVTIDDMEIKDHEWISPRDAIEKHREGEIELVVPTWVTLHHISLYASNTAELLEHFQCQQPYFYRTRTAKQSSGRLIAMWAEDAGYETIDADVQGPRHRLEMSKYDFCFVNDSKIY